MGLLKKIKEPIILKESKRLEEEYDYVKRLSLDNNNSKLKLKEKQLEEVIKSNQKILHELKNSHVPMYILEDVNLEFGEFKDCFDFIVVTRTNIYVIDSKSLFGKIKIDCKGKFTCTWQVNNHNYKEDIDNPILKNEKKLELLKLIGYDKKNMIDKLVFDKLFYLYYKSLIVINSEQTVIDDYYASYDVKDKIISVDKLIDYIKNDNNSSRNKFSDKEMLEIATNILNHHVNSFICYDLVYKDYLLKDDSGSDNDMKLEKELKKYRYYLANREKVSTYEIFSDKVLKSLINKKPVDEEMLSRINGLGKKRIIKYGKKILEIISKYI